MAAKLLFRIQRSLWCQELFGIAYREDMAHIGGLYLSNQLNATYWWISDLATLFGIDGGVSVAAMDPDSATTTYPETVARLRADVSEGVSVQTAERTLRLSATHQFDDYATSAPERYRDLYLYERIEGETGPEDDDKDARLIAYTGDARLQTCTYNTATNTATLTAEVRVEADGDVAIRLGAPGN